MVFLIQQTMLYAVPLMIVALAGVCAERSGVINLALEGIMIFGAFMGVIFIRMFQGMGFVQEQGQIIMLISMLLTGICGVAFSMLLAFSARGPDHRRHCAEHAGAGSGTVFHLYDCAAEYTGHGQWRCGRLVHDPSVHLRASEGLQLGAGT